MTKHILFISSWYPTPEKKSHGIFFKRHAEAAALLNQISAIHVCSGQSNHIDIQLDHKVYTVIGTYKKVSHQLPIISTFFTSSAMEGPSTKRSAAKDFSQRVG
jgi:hypothetical protein